MKKITITDIRKKVAKEVIFWENYSLEFITDITKNYLKQLKKDGFSVRDFSTTQKRNAVKVDYLASKCSQ